MPFTTPVSKHPSTKPPATPTVRFPTPVSFPVRTLVASQQELNRAATPAADKNLTFAAFDSILPVPYGRVLVPALLANAVLYSNSWYFWCIWGQGRIDDIEQIYVDDKVWPASGGRLIPSFLHLGDDVQPVDPWLDLTLTYYFRSVYGSTWPRFRETLPGVAHTTVVMFYGDVENPPTINAVLRGKHVYDPRSVYQRLDDPTTWTYSNNAALCLADFLRSTVYGAGKVVNDNSLIDAANACDAAGRTCDMLIDRKAKVTDHVAALATAANCFIDESGGEVTLIPDSLRSSVMSYAHASGDVITVDSEQTDKREDLSTVIEIIYTNTAGISGDSAPNKWADASVVIERPGVRDGTTPWRKSSVRMPWVQSEAQARREAYLRMNKLWLRTPTFNIQLMDEAVQPQVGEVVTLTYPDSGYSSLRVKVGNAKQTAQGWTFGVFYDDPGAYVDDRIADPTPPTDEPNPFDVPPVENLAGTEAEGGPRLIATWTAPANYPYTGAYPWRVQQVGASPSQVDRGNAIPPRTDFTTVDLTTEQFYVLTVWNRNVFGQLSEPRSVTVYLHDDLQVAVRYKFRTPSLINMEEVFDWSDGHTYWITEMGDLWDATFPNLMDTYTNPLATYHTPGTSSVTTEEYDTGASYTGDWAGRPLATDISGVSAQYIELRALASDAWVRNAAPLFTGTSRRVRFSSEALGTATQRVDDLGEVTVTVDR